MQRPALGPLAALAPVLLAGLCAAHPEAPCGGEDAAALVQGALKLHYHQAHAASLGPRRLSRAAAARRTVLLAQVGHNASAADPFEASTIGDVAPRILSEDAIAALKRSSERSQDEEEDAGPQALGEASAETLAAAIGVALNRITARLDTHLSRTLQVKEQLLHAMAQPPAAGTDRLAVFEALMNETLDVAQQGSSTVAVVLRSTVSSTEANLETAGQRELAATVEAALGAALARFDMTSQPAFEEAKEHVAGLSQDVDSAAQRLAGLREALRAHRRQANALGHALYQQFQDIVSTVGRVVEQNDLPPVSIMRVKTAFNTVQESAAAIAWKLYLPAWELVTGAGVATTYLGIQPHEPAPESADEPFGGAIVLPESTPFKPTAAQTVTRELDLVEQQVDRLLSKTLAARDGLQAAAAATDGRQQSFESMVATAFAAVEADWRAMGEALGRTARSITQCLATAGQHDASLRLDSMFGDALVRSHGLGHLLDEPTRLSSTLEGFLQQQDVLAQSFFRTYHEFMTGIGHTPVGGSPSPTISLRRWREQHPQRAMNGADAATMGKQAATSICSALGAGKTVVHRRLEDPGVIQLDQDAADESEAARRMLRRVQEVAFGSVQQAAAIAWKLHSAAWVLVSGVRKAMVSLIG